MNEKFPHYDKVLSLGAPYTHNALVGKVIIQEKVDGSQFRWGWDNEGAFHIGSKGQELHSADQAPMFMHGFTYLMGKKDKIEGRPRNMWFFGEYLAKPKHNVLHYCRVPNNNIVLFDAYTVLDEGGICWLTREELGVWAKDWDVDLIPELFRGIVTGGIDVLKKFAHETVSYLGGTNVEGLVIKNYAQLIDIHGRVRHLTTKFVRDEFREKHHRINRPRRETIDEFIKGFHSEARWNKAIQRLREESKLENDVKDIGPIIKSIHQDIDEEESDFIKEWLFNRFIKEIRTVSVRGFPDWYKDKLYQEGVDASKNDEVSSVQGTGVCGDSMDSNATSD